MASTVYFSSLETSSSCTPFDIVTRLLYKANLDVIEKNDHLAIKLHFGEYGNLNYIRPQFLPPMLDILKTKTQNIFLTDTNTLYHGMRTEAVHHIQCAIRNGFGYDLMQTPIIIADGLKGQDYVEVSIPGKHFQKVKIASNIYYSDAMLCLSHFKLHELAGYGGAIKNLSMGCAARAGKYDMHASLGYHVNKHCTKCGACIKKCIHDAIELHEKQAVITDRCVGCGHCLLVCKQGAIQPDYSTHGNQFLERMVEYACGAVQDKTNKCLYMNFLNNVATACDCVSFTPPKIVDDIGILLSTDPVACDKACIDLVNQQNDQYPDIIAHHHPTVDYAHTLVYAEALGMGSRAYDLIDISRGK